MSRPFQVVWDLSRHAASETPCQARRSRSLDSRHQSNRKTPDRATRHRQQAEFVELLEAASSRVDQFCAEGHGLLGEATGWAAWRRRGCRWIMRLQPRPADPRLEKRALVRGLPRRAGVNQPGPVQPQPTRRAASHPRGTASSAVTWAAKRCGRWRICAGYLGVAQASSCQQAPADLPGRGERGGFSRYLVHALEAGVRLSELHLRAGQPSRRRCSAAPPAMADLPLPTPPSCSRSRRRGRSSRPTSTPRPTRRSRMARRRQRSRSCISRSVPSSRTTNGKAAPGLALLLCSGGAGGSAFVEAHQQALAGGTGLAASTSSATSGALRVKSVHHHAPSSTLARQVQHTPALHENGRSRPALRAASSTRCWATATSAGPAEHHRGPRPARWAERLAPAPGAHRVGTAQADGEVLGADAVGGHTGLQQGVLAALIMASGPR